MTRYRVVMFSPEGVAQLISQHGTLSLARRARRRVQRQIDAEDEGDCGTSSVRIFSPSGEMIR